ncbi:MAG: sulfotransferase [Bacteroidetes bacterium]|jgi:hypothetical protein|nr:sulfotransferase [Bacteroidota bacterium]MDA0972097.1 sulfotransferase [Bacteroidota bacterium]
MKKKPDFFVIGVVKGGSTSLYHYLDQHPEVYLPPIKETNHFAKADIHPEDFLPEYALDVKLDLDAYIKKGMPEKIHIAHVNSDEHYFALYDKVEGEKTLGDVSNSYMVCPSSAQAIHDFNPDSKLIVILRNPIGRAWSQYLMNLREAKTQEKDFISELERDAEKSPSGWGVNHQYLELGNYGRQLERYLQLFPREQLKVIFYEEYRDRPLDILKDICHFLEVDETFQFDVSSKKNTASLPRSASLNALLVKTGVIKTLKGMVPKQLRGSLAKVLYSDKDLPSIAAEEKAYLVRYYASEVRLLSSLIEVDASNYWPQFK